MGGGQLAVRDNAGAARATVDPGKGHRARLSPGLRLEAEVDRVLCDGAGRVGRRLPGEVSALRTLEGEDESGGGRR